MALPVLQAPPGLTDAFLMRIPSQLNDETLYGRRGRPSQSPQPYRRLIRLSVALALVVAVMSQANQPGVYEVFFGEPDASELEMGVGASSTPPPPPAASLSGKTDPIGDPKSDARRVSIEAIDQATRSVAAIIADSLSPNEQRQWTVVLDQWQSNESVRVIESMVSALVDVVQQVEGIDDDQRFAWTKTLRRFRDSYAADDEIFADSSLAAAPDLKPALQSSPLETIADQSDTGTASDSSDDAAVDRAVETTVNPADDLQRLAALLAALDQAAVDRVVDGAIWRSADFDAFYRQLDQASFLSNDGAIGISVVPLMQQPQTYLGQRVQVAGRVARVNKKDAAANPFGVQTYWELWLRPQSGGDRPFLLIVPDVSVKVSRLDGELNIHKGPEIKVVGRFFKRLAYGSQFGADAAPVVIGRILGLGNPLSNTIATNATTQSTTNNRGESYSGKSPTTDLLIVLALASIVGIVIAAFVMWRTKVLAKRSRQLRQSNRPNPDLNLVGLPDETRAEKIADVDQKGSDE